MQILRSCFRNKESVSEKVLWKNIYENGIINTIPFFYHDELGNKTGLLRMIYGIK